MLPVDCPERQRAELVASACIAWFCAPVVIRRTGSPGARHRDQLPEQDAADALPPHGASTLKAISGMNPD
jgi:hypothetical protein